MTRADMNAENGFTLPRSVRRTLEAVFAADFSGVRVHVGPQAAQLSARAFACGSDLYFAEGRFQPATPGGLRLLGHELCHVVQQRTGRVSVPAAPGVAVLEDPRLEAEAKYFGSLAAGAPCAPPLLGAAVGSVHYLAPEFLGLRCRGSTPMIVQMDDDDDDDDDSPDIGAKEALESDPYRKALKYLGYARTGVKGVVSAGTKVLGHTGVAVAAAGMAGFHLSAGVLGIAATAALPILGPVGIALSVVDIGLSAKAAASTYSHIKKLEQIVVKHKRSAFPGTLEAIQYASNKKNNKLRKKGTGCIPFLGSIANSIYRAGKAAYKKAKGTKGVNRMKQSIILWGNAYHGDHCAQMACKELLGAKTYEKIKGYSDGFEVLGEKMKSL